MAVLLGCLAILTCLSPRAGWADQWFLKLDATPGTVTDGRFAGWTPVDGVATTVGPAPFSTNGTPVAGSFRCELRKALDRATSLLLQHHGDGTPLRRVTLACILPLPRPQLHRITIENATVSSLTHEGTGDSAAARGAATETWTLQFSRMESACLDLDEAGGVEGGPVARLDRNLGAGDLRTRPPLRVTVAQENGRPGVRLTWTAERGHRYAVRLGTANGGVWRTTEMLTAPADGPLSRFIPTDMPGLLMKVEEVD